MHQSTTLSQPGLMTDQFSGRANRRLGG